MFIGLQLLTQSESRQAHLWGAQAEVSGTHHAALQGPLQHDLSGTGASQLCRNLLDDRTAQHRVLLVAPHQPLSPQAAVRLRTATSNCFSEAGFHSERSRCVLASTPAGCSVCSVQPQCTWYWMPEIRQYASISTSWLKGSLFRCTTAGLISANFSSSASSTMSKLLTPARSITTSRALAGHTRDNHRAGVPRVICVRMKNAPHLQLAACPVARRTPAPSSCLSRCPQGVHCRTVPPSTPGSAAGAYPGSPFPGPSGTAGAARHIPVLGLGTDTSVRHMSVDATRPVGDRRCVLEEAEPTCSSCRVADAKPWCRGCSFEVRNTLRRSMPLSRRPAPTPGSQYHSRA